VSESAGDDRLGELRQLGQLADAMGPALAPSSGQDLLNAIVKAAQSIFGAAACSLAVLTSDSTELVFTSVSGEGEEAVSGLRIPASAGVAGWVVMSGQAVAVSETRRDPRFAEDVAASTGFVPTTILAAPVATERQVIGVMEVLDRDADRAGAERDLELLGLFAGQAGLAIEASRVFEHFGDALLRAAAASATALAADDHLGAEWADALAAALRAAAASNEQDVGPPLLLASVVAELGALGAAEQRLAVGILAEVTAYLRRRDRRAE